MVSEFLKKCMSLNQIQNQNPLGWTSTVETVEEQIEFDCFSKEEIPLATVAVKIIAEVMRLCPDIRIKIGGEQMFAGDVQAVYRELTHENVINVIVNFSEIKYPVRSPKAYLRTSLYNEGLYGKAKDINDFNTLYT